MKLDRYRLRYLIESLVNEDDSGQSKFKSGQGAKVTFEEIKTNPESDNMKAHKFQDSKAARKKYNIPGSGDYFVYRAPGKESMNIGNVRYSKGDPYTYKAEANGYYRVMSGPSHKEKGTRPIGAKFKPSSPPKDKIESKVSIDFGEVFKSDVSNITGKKASELISELKADLLTVLDAIASKDKSTAEERLNTMQSMINMSLDNKTGRQMAAQGYGALFQPGIQSKETILANLDDLKMCLEMIDMEYDSAGMIQQYIPNVDKNDIPDAQPGQAEKDAPGGEVKEYFYESQSKTMMRVTKEGNKIVKIEQFINTKNAYEKISDAVTDLGDFYANNIVKGGFKKVTKPEEIGEYKSQADKVLAESRGTLYRRRYRRY
jgi:hypothetical protein